VSGLLQELNQQYEIGLRVLDNKELQASFPGLISGAGDECAVYEPHSGYINPVDYVAMWVNEGRAAGGVALETTNVASLLRHGNRVAGISTSIGEIHAQHVIIAAGAWTPGLMQAEGLETTIRTKGIQVNLIKKAAAFPHPIVIDERTGFFTRPARNDISFAGTTIQDWGRSPDKDIFASPSDETLAALAARFPWLNRGELSGARCAVDAYTPDGNGITDWVDGVKDLYIASGWSGCGIKVAPAVATHVANEILNTQAGKSDVE
jgi:glycine/D-amino acid oxidase-like deaminating enzyme